MIQTNELLTPKHEMVYEIARGAFGEEGKEEEGKQENKVIAILPDLIDERMIAQLSVFTIHNNKKPLEDYENSSQYLVKYKIPSSAKVKLKVSSQ
jgi:hypothetical protein